MEEGYDYASENFILYAEQLRNFKIMKIIETEITRDEIVDAVNSGYDHLSYIFETVEEYVYNNCLLYLLNNYVPGMIEGYKDDISIINKQFTMLTNNGYKTDKLLNLIGNHILINIKDMYDKALYVLIQHLLS